MGGAEASIGSGSKRSEKLIALLIVVTVIAIQRLIINEICTKRLTNQAEVHIKVMCDIMLVISRLD